MSFVPARELIAKLRSGGVKVYLRPDGTVNFSDLSTVSAELKHSIIHHGAAMKAVLAEEVKIRESRAKLKKRK